jgi:nicotinamidase-related amidase
MKSSQALMIIDAQVNMFDENFSIYQGDRIIKILSLLIDKARAKGVSAIYVRNNGGEGEPDEVGTEGWEIHPAILPRAKETVIDKQGADAFENTNLREILEEENIKELIIAGMQTEVCIESTTKRAIELGYKIVLVEDGHSTFDFDDMNAIDEINRVNRELRPLVNLLKAENIELN